MQYPVTLTRRVSVAMASLMISAVIMMPNLAFAGGPPDLLTQICVDTSDRPAIRAVRDECDQLATLGALYNVGILRPCNNHDITTGAATSCDCLGGELYLCLGAPGLD